MTQLFGTLTAESVHTALGGVSPPTAIAFQGDRHPTHRSNPVKQFITNVAIFAAITAMWTYAGTIALDKATANQCRTHDWPVEKNEVHMDWCNANGYVTK